MPDVQLVQTAAEVAPTEVPKVPAGQDVQLAWAVSGL